MYHNEIYSDINEALPQLCRKLLNEGDEVGSRLGDRTQELTHVGVTLTNPLNREITLPLRRSNIAAQIAETMWVLAGRDDIAWLSNYLPRAADFSDDGATWRGAYGPRLRRWLDNTDQLSNVVALLKSSSLTRRAVMSIFDPGQDFIPDSKDIPCNNWLSFTNRNGKLDLHVAIRSNDLIWGWSGINAFEWSVLQEIVAGLVGVGVGSLHFSITSLHVYDRHWKRAREIAHDFPVSTAYESPRFDLDGGLEHLDMLIDRWFQIEEKLRTSYREEDLNEWIALLETFPEPMLRSWLYAIAYYWTEESDFFDAIEGTPLGVALSLAPGRSAPKNVVLAVINDKGEEVPVNGAKDIAPLEPKDTAFNDYVATLHAGKHAAYGDSWKRRGEMLGIMANIARKVDRLGVTDDNETAADTAIDLLVYLIKYRVWLAENGVGPWPFPENTVLQHLDPVQQVAFVLSKLPPDAVDLNEERVTGYIQDRFSVLEGLVMAGDENRYREVSDLIVDANKLARHLYWKLGNATRSWNPEPVEMVTLPDWPYRPSQEQKSERWS